MSETTNTRSGEAVQTAPTRADQSNSDDLMTVGEQARARFDRLIADLEAAAAEWGLRPELPEWKFVSAMIQTQSGFADIANALTHELHSLIAAAKAAADVELERQRETTEALKFTLAQARSAIKNVEAQTAAVASQMIQEATPQIVKGIRQAVVLRELRWNRNAEWGFAAAIGAGMLGLFLCGYSWRVSQEWHSIRLAQQTEAALGVCLKDGPLDSQGRRYCPYDSFLPK